MKTVSIISDEMPMNPRKEFDNLGRILYTSARYYLGDERVSVDEINAIANDSGNIWLPVYAYIHSGTCLNTTGFNCPWDSGKCGIIYVSKDRIREEYKVKRITKKILEKVKAILISEIETFSNYLSGDCYGYVIKDEAGNEVESIFGFYGMDSVKAEAESMLQFYNK